MIVTAKAQRARSLRVGMIHELPLAGSGYEHEPAAGGKGRGALYTVFDVERRASSLERSNRFVLQHNFAGSSLQLEPGGLCISGRCDCSTGHRLFKLPGSGYKPEPARLVGAVSRRRLTAYDSAQAPVRQQELAPTKNMEIPVH